MLRTHRHGLNSNRTTPMNKTSLFVEFFHYAYDFFFFFHQDIFFLQSRRFYDIDRFSLGPIDAGCG